VVRVCMRDGKIFDVGRFDTKLLELARKRHGPLPMGCLRIGRRQPIGHCGNRVGHASVPQHPIVAVADQITIVDERHRFADIDAWGPARDVAGNAFAAIEYVEFVDEGNFLGEARRARDRQRDNSGVRKLAKFITALQVCGRSKCNGMAARFPGAAHAQPCDMLRRCGICEVARETAQDTIRDKR
jgi:hypothetical protein